VGLVLITGNCGTGKSTVRLELARRGFSSYDTDEDGIAGWRLRATGEPVEGPVTTPDGWLTQHAWIIDRSRVEHLAFLARDRVVFLCGSVENEAEVWELFTRVVCLVVDEATIRERLAKRSTNTFGKAPAELKAVLDAQRTSEAFYRGWGARIVDANQPLADVVDQALAEAGDAAW
jgi:dephospho-CoA kinase